MGDSIKMYLKELRCEGVTWIHVTQERCHCQVLVNMVMILSVP